MAIEDELRDSFPNVYGGRSPRSSSGHDHFDMSALPREVPTAEMVQVSL